MNGERGSRGKKSYAVVVPLPFAAPGEGVSNEHQSVLQAGGVRLPERRAENLEAHEGNARQEYLRCLRGGTGRVGGGRVR